MKEVSLPRDTPFLALTTAGKVATPKVLLAYAHRSRLDHDRVRYHPYLFITSELGAISAIHLAVPAAEEKLFMDASASASERQCTIATHVPSLPGRASRDTKPGRFSM
jgi:hypothetical protein